MEKPKKQSRLSKLFENRAFRIAFGLTGLVLAYIFASFAIDSGSLLDYAITLILLFIGVRELAAALFKRGAR
ncbi:hypothetical protein IRY61_02060 [Candidatus Saccharibacteria bacterium]|nr:hypothetical protein [Candidatus Saccharibacteria bacterium]